MRVNTNFRKWMAIITIVLSACSGGYGEVNNGGGIVDSNNIGVFPLTTLDITAPDIKTLQLSWPDAPAETGYGVFEQLEGAPAAVEVASLPANTTQLKLGVFPQCALQRAGLQRGRLHNLYRGRHRRQCRAQPGDRLFQI